MTNEYSLLSLSPPWSFEEKLQEQPRILEMIRNEEVKKWLAVSNSTGSLFRRSIDPKRIFWMNNGNLWIAKFPSKMII